MCVTNAWVRWFFESLSEFWASPWSCALARPSSASRFCSSTRRSADEIAADVEAELELEVVERLLVAADGVDPGTFGRKDLLLQTAEVRLGDAPFLSQGAAAFGVFAGALQVQEVVAGGVPVAQHAVISGGDLNAEVFAVAREIAQVVKELAFG